MLSIIIPALNEEGYLPLLLGAIKNQSFKDLEIIVADGGSEDRTTEIAKNYGCKVVRGGSPAKGRNEGAKVAQGEIFLFMDADNIYLPENFLKNLLEEFKKRRLGIASFPIYPVSVSDLPLLLKNGIIKNDMELEAGNRFDKLAYTIYNFWVLFSQKFLAHATNSVLVKREIHQKIGGFDEEIKIGEDHDFARRASKIAKFGFIKTERVLTSARRLKRDGRFKTYLKYLLAGAYMLFLGPVKSDIFKYRLTRPLKKSKKEI